MCAINGIFSVRRVESIESRIQNMNDAVNYRGPDAGICNVVNESTAFAHRRLAILDLDRRSDQPMVSKKGNILVFNGEIYNYKDLKAQLDGPFRTTSDTEVILAAYEQKGLDWFLEHCNGMFAIAIYDIQKDQLVLVRDRMGVKPLYYYQDDRLFVFASEIKSILRSGLVDAIFNEEAVDEYLGNRYVRAPYTFFKNITQVKPGHQITLKRNSSFKIEDRAYWKLPASFNTDKEYNEDKIAEEFDERVRNAIKLRMISDVPLGTYLSGGVDSSLISAIVSENTNSQINTYTIGFKENNEFDYAQIIAEKYHTNHHEILINEEDYFNAILDVIKFKDAPLGVPNEVPLAYMSKVLKKDITVVLSGEGADELMGGYGKIFRSPYDYINQGSNKDVDFYDFFIGKYEYVPRTIRNKFLTTPKSYREEFDESCRSLFSSHSNEESIFRFFHTYHVKGLLQRVDSTTMLASVEARVPFLDHSLIEYTYKHIPYELKMHWNYDVNHHEIKRNSSFYSEVLDTPKYLLRKISEKYMPLDVVYRRKVGFPVPLNAWMESLLNRAETILTDASWLHIENLKSLIDDCKSNERAGQLVWMFINIQLFKNEYFNRSWRY